MQMVYPDYLPQSPPFHTKQSPYLKEGWPPMTKDENIKPYLLCRNELMVEGDCIMRGIRVIIPSKLREKVLQELHLSHPGIHRMKLIVRSHIWWPQIDRDIENAVRACKACLEVKQSPAIAPLHPWIWPSKPWSRIHIDFAGPFLGTSYLIIVDAHSKWVEILEMSSTTAGKTIQELRHMFARYGLPDSSCL